MVSDGVQRECAAAVHEAADATGFSGVVRVDRGVASPFVAAYGLADRGHRILNTAATRFAIASGTKGMTAVVVMRLVDDGVLELGTLARDVLGADLPLVDPAVTVELLLSHRSGVGDYVDEAAMESANDYVLDVPLHTLVSTESYLSALSRRPQVFAPGERFAYCNSGYVILALIAERCAGQPFATLVERFVCAPAGMRDTAFLRSDEPRGGVAVGYLERDGLRTNALHLPVVGSGDGGLSTTANDIRTFWTALFSRRLVSDDALAALVRPRSEVPEEGMHYGLGFWLEPEREGVVLIGSDAGMSFHSLHVPGTFTATVLANTTDGAWPLVRALKQTLTE